MTDLVRRTSDVDSWTEVLGPVGELARDLARTEFVPRAMQGKPASVAAAILTGRELGLGPMTALRGIDVIEGRPSLTAEMLAARILSAGHRVEWKASTDQRCTVRIERGDGLSESEVTWTMADAQRAGLSGKKVWQQYPRHMLRARAITECASMACPDVALGLDVEASVYESPAASGPQTVTLSAHTASEPVKNQEVAPDATPTPEPQQEPAQPAPDVPDAITPAQLRKIGALIGEWETVEGRKLDRAERRRLIGFMAGVEDPDALESANALSKAQASAAIEALAAEIEAAKDAPVEAEIVEEPTP
jgi:hypothetical protein